METFSVTLKQGMDGLFVRVPYGVGTRGSVVREEELKSVTSQEQQKEVYHEGDELVKKSMDSKKMAWRVLSQFQFKFDASTHIVHEENTPMIDVYKALCVPVASCEMFTVDKVSKSGYASDFDDNSNFLSDAEDGFLDGSSFNRASSVQEISHDKSVVFHMRDVKCSGKSFASNSFASIFIDQKEMQAVVVIVMRVCGQKTSWRYSLTGYLLDKRIVESLEAIDEKSTDIKKLEVVKPLDEQDDDDGLGVSDPLLVVNHGIHLNINHDVDILERLSVYVHDYSEKAQEDVETHLDEGDVCLFVDKVSESGYASDFDDNSNFLSDAEDGFLNGSSFIRASSVQELSHDKFVVFHMRDVKCSGKSFASDSFASSFIDQERDASSCCDCDEGVWTKDLMMSNTYDISNSKNNASVHMLPLAGTYHEQKKSLVDKDFVACGEAILPNGYLLDKHIVESLEAIDEKSVDVKKLEVVKPLDEQDDDDGLGVYNPLLVVNVAIQLNINNDVDILERLSVYVHD
ncbi:hypothetical protein L7F22_055097 [Adiantum nelumboides]|nr:hypothetical protein [Adiantum nelumboides]